MKSIGLDGVAGADVPQAIGTMNRTSKQSGEQAGGSSYAQIAFVSQWRLPPAAHAVR
jgi:hypothetical protein